MISNGLEDEDPYRRLLWVIGAATWTLPLIILLELLDDALAEIFSAPDSERVE